MTAQFWRLMLGLEKGLNLLPLESNGAPVGRDLEGGELVLSHAAPLLSESVVDEVGDCTLPRTIFTNKHEPIVSDGNVDGTATVQALNSKLA